MLFLHIANINLHRFLLIVPLECPKQLLHLLQGFLKGIYSQLLDISEIKLLHLIFYSRTSILHLTRSLDLTIWLIHSIEWSYAAKRLKLLLVNDFKNIALFFKSKVSCIYVDRFSKITFLQKHVLLILLGLIKLGGLLGLIKLGGLWQESFHFIIILIFTDKELTLKKQSSLDFWESCKWLTQITLKFLFYFINNFSVNV